METFKIGDRVRRIECENRDRNGKIIRVGDEGVVDKVYGGGFIGLAGKPLAGGSDPQYFELLPPLKAKRPARSTDPATSKAAAKPKREGLKQKVLHRLTILGGHTGEELHCALGYRLNSITPRFAELRREGKIKDSGVRRDGQIVWEAA